ncbi:MAG: hypothetical protein IT368_10955 [Candidatus Hydrogenedentes bacterium]|nr:hypothetical protein [Candidatus Hydrogenedentota bacterium]
MIRDEKTVRVDLESGRLFDIPVVAIAAEFDTKSTIWLLGSNGNVQVPYPLSYHREATFYTLVWPDADGVEKILVYRINAWEEFIVPFEFGDVPAGRE